VLPVASGLALILVPCSTGDAGTSELVVRFPPKRRTRISRTTAIAIWAISDGTTPTATLGSSRSGAAGASARDRYRPQIRLRRSVSVGRSIVAVDAERCLLLTIRSSQPARLCKRVNEAGAGPGAIITGTSPLADSAADWRRWREARLHRFGVGAS